MDRVSMVGTVLVALLLMTTPVAATASVASQSGGPGQSGMHVATAETDRSAPSEAVSLNDTDGNETSGENTTTDSSTPCCGGGGPADRPVWKYDSNYDAEINYSEAYDSYQDYLDDIVTWETYLNVSEAYDDNETVLYPDPDGDGMTIREEEIWSDYGGYFAKYSTNLDDDQFSDFADPRPNTEDIPPNISVSFPDGIWDSYVNVTFSDENGIQEWEIIERYESRGELHTIDQPVTSFEVFDLTDNITVRAVDNNGNEREILLNITENDDVRLMRSEIAAAGLTPAAHHTGGSVIGSLSGTAGITVAGLGVAGFTGGLIAAPISQLFVGKNTDGTEVENTASTTSSKRYKTFSSLAPPVETAVESGTVTLPTGHVESANDPAGGELHRGYGYEYIQEATGLYYYSIQSVLSNEDYVEHIYQDGGKTVVIGDNPYMDPIAISIIGGVVKAASAAEYNSDCEDTVQLEWKDRPEHAIRDGKALDDVPQLRDIIRDPDRVLDTTSGQRYYIAELVTNEVAMIVLNGGPDWWRLMTSKDSNGKFFKTVDEAEDAIDEEIEDTVYDEDTGTNNC